MPLHPLAGQPAPREMLVDVARLERDYLTLQPDPANPAQAVSFGTSGHRGTPGKGTFNEAHILAITQAIGEYRHAHNITGPLFMGMDTHAISASAQRTALEVLAALGVEVCLQHAGGFTPTPAISHAILTHNRGRSSGLADGLIITPSHNPPADGGFKYNPPYGGPADSAVTGWIERRANEWLRQGTGGIRRLPYERALLAPSTHPHDFISPFVNDLAQVLNLAAVREARVRIGVDPLGGASLRYWEPIQAAYDLALTVVNTRVDPQFGFMTLDHDGQIRMDCSSPHAMAGLIALKDRFQVAFGNDPDADRHGIVTPAGLMNPNHYLAVAIHYLIHHRPRWPKKARIGKTIVSSRLIDRVVRSLDRELLEVPVGFKWFAPGLHDGSVAFGGEESAGASFQRLDGTAWSTDKDGLILGLLAAEITAVTGRDPAQHYRELTAQFGAPLYTRIDAPVTPEQKAAFQRLTADSVTATELAGDPITRKLTHAPGNQAAIGGLKVETEHGWFAARPSGTENLYKLYAESFRDEAHLNALLDEARQLVSRVLDAPAQPA
ncbi:MAG: phosphoglucomutase (alpha-D-glucose-1,6-bisphosphate-dependent) [Verrucomicrobiae bacterium]|nr:phosphoglucomutase (alpha-D-glucose-1,6-bisphosphate-dependent) [Verrucomicrobiae bacterium]